jgi:hypothetical protein
MTMSMTCLQAKLQMFSNKGYAQNKIFLQLEGHGKNTNLLKRANLTAELWEYLAKIVK